MTPCDRCKKPPALYTTMSRFNLEIICEACETREQAHPEYERAAEAERQSLERGERNFPGIGLPADLR